MAQDAQYLVFGHDLKGSLGNDGKITSTPLLCVSSRQRPLYPSQQASKRTVCNHRPVSVKLNLRGLSVKLLKTNISHNICACCAAPVHYKICHGVKLARVDHAVRNLVSLRQLKASPSAMHCHINIKAH